MSHRTKARKFLIAGVVLLVAAAGTVRVRRYSLGWGAYWSIDLAAPWHR